MSMIRASSCVTSTDQAAESGSDLAEKCLTYLERYQVLICHEHRYAVRNLSHHLKHCHKFSKAGTAQIVKRYGTLPCLPPSKVPQPDPCGPAFTTLGEPLQAYRCDEDGCSNISVNRRTINQHCNQQHGWRWTPDEPEHWTPVKVQTFFATGGFQRYFVVADGTDQAQPRRREPLAAIDNNQQQVCERRRDAQDVSLILDKCKTAEDRRKQFLKVADSKVAQTDRTGWFNRTGWPEHFAGCDLQRISRRSALPGKDENLLKEAARTVEHVIERSVAGLATLDLETRRWLRSPQRKEIALRPLARLQNPDSQLRYASYAKRFVCYLIRLAQEEECQSSVDLESSELSDFDSGSDSGSEDGTQGSDSLESNARSTLLDGRHLFPWQESQKCAVNKLLLVLSSDDEERKVSCTLELFRTVIFQSVSNDLFSSALVHFAAVLGIDEDNNRLRSADHYSYMLAGLVYCVRVLAAELLLPSASREQQSVAERKAFLRARSQYLVDGSYSPMSILVSLLAYGKSVAMNTSNAAATQWSADGKVLRFHGKRVVLERFKQMISSAIAECEEMLWAGVLQLEPKERFEIPLDELEDDVTFTQRGYSFVHKASNGLRGGLEWLVRHLVERSRRWATGKPLQKDGSWNRRGVAHFTRQIDKFLKVLLFLVHTTGGQPARGTEITSARHRNGYLQDRNVFVIDGQVVFISRYHKTQSAWDKPRIIPRFLPWRVGQLVAMYMGYLQSLHEYFVVEMLGGTWTDYIWGSGDAPWSTERLTAVIKAQTAMKMGCALNTLDYRHVAIAIGRREVGDHFAQGCREEIGEDEFEEPEQELNSGLELQAGRTEKIGVQTYGVPIDIVQHLSVRSTTFFRQLSGAWHVFLGLASRKESTNASSKRKRPLSEETVEAQTKRICRFPAAKRTEDPDAQDEIPTELQKAMRQVLRCEQVAFRSAEQAEAMYAILRGESPLVIVLGTSVGKTLLFTAPACFEDPGVTIVVVPLRALLIDLSKRLEEAGIEHVEWRVGETNPAPIVLVSANAVGNWSFMSYATLLDQKKLLRRVVVDECHLTYTASHYRPRLRQLKHLRSLSCPLVLLTATHPPLLQLALEESMLIRNARYIRASTIRKTVRYRVQWCSNGTLMATCLRLCRWRREMLQGCKGIVFCRTREDSERVASALGCGYYHSELAVDRRKAVLDYWLSQGGLLAATTSLGAGVDYPGVVFVLHVGLPYGMIDFAQESGRGGRGGELVDSVVLVEKNTVQWKDQGLANLDESAMISFVLADGCRRRVLSEFLDGIGQSCSDGNYETCDRCGEGIGEWHEWQALEQRERQIVENTLEEMAHGCPSCWIRVGKQAGESHKGARCREGPQELQQAGCDDFRGSIRYARDTKSCFKCGLSQKMCVRGRDYKQTCQWPRTVPPILIAVMGNGVEGAEILKAAGYRGEIGNWETYRKWLGQRRESLLWDEVASNAMAVVVETLLFLEGGSK